MTSLQAFSGDLQALVQRTAPAVVGIEHRRGQGTGFNLTSDGYLLTNRHVVGNAETVGVRTRHHGLLRGEVIGRDAPTDLAVVRVEARDLPTLPLARRPARLGEVVVAIGNPFRFEGTVSLGVVSGLDRALPVGQTLMEGVIQTDAAINPGNSGGPLLDASGAVVGVTTAIVPFAQGIGFAIPARASEWVAGLLIKRGHIERPYLGIAGRSEALAPDLAERLGQARAIRVVDVQTATPAQAAGLEADDLLLAADGHPLGTVDDLQRHMVLAAGPTLTLELWRSQERRHFEVVPRPPVPIARDRAGLN